MEKEKLDLILAKHKKWLYNEPGGEKADLRSANLSYADLRSANLRSANLSSADLRSAKTDHRYISISGIGSEKRLTIFDLTDDVVMCGCFRGSLKDFEIRVKKNHEKNKVWLAEYMGAIAYIKSLLTDKKGEAGK
jgi:hypothetical protein